MSYLVLLVRYSCCDIYRHCPLCLCRRLPETLRLVYPKLFGSVLHALRLLMDPLSKVLEIFRVECIEPLSLYVRFFMIMTLPVVSFLAIRLVRHASDARAARGGASTDLIVLRKAKNQADQDYRTFFMFFLLCMYSCLLMSGRY